MSNDVLVSHVSCLKECLLTSWMHKGGEKIYKDIVDGLVTSLDDYTTYLSKHSKVVKQKQDSFSVSDTGTLKLLTINASVSGKMCDLKKGLLIPPILYTCGYRLNYIPLPLEN